MFQGPQKFPRFQVANRINGENQQPGNSNPLTQIINTQPAVPPPFQLFFISTIIDALFEELLSPQFFPISIQKINTLYDCFNKVPIPKQKNYIPYIPISNISEGRKRKNRISAQNSRNRKRQYVEELKKRKCKS